MEYLNFNDFRYSVIELYEFADFHASNVESLNFQYSLDSVVELKEFQDFPESNVK